MDNYPYIPYIPDKKDVIRRMGALKASFTGDIEGAINEYLHKAQSLFTVRGRAEVFDLKLEGEDIIEIGGFEVRSNLLKKMLSGSSKAYLMCTTIPEKEVAEINLAINEGQGLKAFVLDAYASEFVDGALDVIIERKNAALRRMGQQLTSKRFSAGYGDLDIKYQKIFYELLQMQTLGVNISDRFLLTPEKSVIAIAGVE